MKQPCRVSTIQALRQQVTQIAPVVRCLRPEFLQELFESCDAEHRSANCG